MVEVKGSSTSSRSVEACFYRWCQARNCESKTAFESQTNFVFRSTEKIKWTCFDLVLRSKKKNARLRCVTVGEFLN